MAQNDIRVICLSDIHFGEEDSLLTCLEDGAYRCNPRGVSPVLERLVSCLRHLVSLNRGPRKPTLVLAGDVIDLAFASVAQSLMTFERFLELVAAPGRELFERIVYVPGNHDHHVWEIARETQYVRAVLDRHTDGDLPEPSHTSPLFGDGRVPSYLLNQIVRHARGVASGDELDYPIEVAYPNLGLVSGDRERAVVISHGHYVEGRYWLVSKLRRWLFPHSEHPETVERLEQENFAWIDFVWSLLGRSGAAGADVEILYKRLQFRANADAFVDDLARRVAEEADIPFVPGDFLERKLLKVIFERLGYAAGGERCRGDEAVRAEIETGLRAYLFGPTMRQVEHELGGVPADLTFVFGHTHKPFEDRFVDGDSDVAIKLYNTGGWTVDSVEPRPTQGGAVVVVSDDLHVASIRMYNETSDPADYAVRVASAPGTGPGGQQFATMIAERIGVAIDAAPDPASPWRAFSEHIATEVDLRRQHLAREFLSQGE